MTPEAAARDFLNELSTRPPARAPATVSEIMASEWAASGLDTLTGSLAPMEEAYEELAKKAEALTGKSVRLHISVPVEERVDHVRFLARDLDAEKKRELEPLFDVRLNAAKKAQAIEREASDTRAATYGLSGNALALLTGMARQVVDPVNLATIPVGGPLKGPVLKMLGREFLLNATIQATQEPVIQSARGELGLEAGFSEALANSLEAGAGAAGLSGLFRAAGAGVRYLRDRRPASLPPQMAEWDGQRTFTGYLTPDDAEGLDRGVSYPAYAPAAYGEGTGIGLPFGGNFDFDAGARARPTAEKLPERPPPPRSDLAIGYLTPEDTTWLDRGVTYPAYRPAAIGEAEFDLPGLAGAFDFRSGARARPTREKTPERAPLPPGDEPRGYLTPDDAESLDRGEILPPVRDPRGSFDLLHAFRVVDNFSPADFEAAARAMERNQVIADQIEAPDLETRFAQERAIEAAAETMEKGAPAQDLPMEPLPAPLNAPRPKRGPAARDPNTWSLFEYLASKGGLKPDPELDAIFDGRNPFVPGFGPLIRKSGMDLDRAREGATIEKYLLGEASGGGSTSVNEFLRLVEAEGRGRRQYIAGHEKPLGRDFDPAENRAMIERAFEGQMADAEIDTATLDRPLIERALQIMDKEGERDALVAFERAAMEDRDRYERAFKRRKADETFADIPGWDVPDDAGAAPPQRGASARDGSRHEPGGKAGDGEAGEPVRDPGGGDRTPAGQGKSLQDLTLGDPALAREAERILAEGGDFAITVKQPDGTFRTISAREILQEAEEEAAAARELIDCIGIKPEGPT